jgi:hypothetical protein
MYHRPYCKELVGLPAGPGSAVQREDPEGYFTRARGYTTDSRLDPKVVDGSGNVVPFSSIRKGDIINVRVAVETHCSGRGKIGFHLVLRRVTIIKHAEPGPSKGPDPKLGTFTEQNTLHVLNDSHL